MGINILFMNANVDLFHDSTKNSSGILTSESNEMDLNILIVANFIVFHGNTTPF